MATEEDSGTLCSPGPTRTVWSGDSERGREREGGRERGREGGREGEREGGREGRGGREGGRDRGREGGIEWQQRRTLEHYVHQAPPEMFGVETVREGEGGREIKEGRRGREGREGGGREGRERGRERESGNRGILWNREGREGDGERERENMLCIPLIHLHAPILTFRNGEKGGR